VKIIRKTALALSAAVVFSSPAYAGGLPTFDVVSMTQKIVELQNLIDTVENTHAQFEEAKKQVESISGLRDMGDLFNTDIEKSFRTHMPSTFNEVLDLASDGGKASGYIAQVTEIYQPTPASEIWEDTTTPIAQRYQRGVDYTINTMAISESAYEVASMRNETLAALQVQLDTTTDLKSSVDLQSRILIEQSYIANEAIRLQALALQGQADDKAANFEKARGRRSFVARPTY